MKGNYGIRLAAYTVLAFLLSYFGSTTLLFLVLGVVLLAEKNEWATRQVLQALVLCYVGVIVRNVLNIFDFVYDIPSMFVSVDVLFNVANVLVKIWRTIENLINSVVDLAVLVLVVIGIIKNLKDQDANLPLVKNVVDWVYDIAKEKKEKKEEAPAAVEEKAE